MRSAAVGARDEEQEVRFLRLDDGAVCEIEGDFQNTDSLWSGAPEENFPRPDRVVLRRYRGDWNDLIRREIDLDRGK